MNGFLHYRGYAGSIVFSERDQVFHGRVVGIKDMLSFEGENVTELTTDFHNAVDEYLAFCDECGKTPEKPYKGSFNVRIGSGLHREAAEKAATLGISLNSLVEKAIRQVVSE
jgi:predicted HicB family RNase H-like nuclease